MHPVSPESTGGAGAAVGALTISGRSSMSKSCPLVLLLAISCLATPAVAQAAKRDRDSDRLPDRWEHKYHLSLTKKSAKGDPDKDRLTNRQELKLRTNPRKADTDGDRLKDRAEV